MISSRKLRGIDYGICESSDIEEMASLLAETFSLHDPPAVAVGLTAQDFRPLVRLLGPQAAAEGLTIIARAAGSGVMAGALLTQDSATPPPGGMDRIGKRFAPIFDILGQLDADYWQERRVRPGEALHLFLLGVGRSFGGRGVAQGLVHECLENGRQRGYHLAVTEATNTVSQHIFRKLGFVDRVSRSYRDHRFEGKAVFAAIEGHGGPVLMDKAIS